MRKLSRKIISGLGAFACVAMLNSAQAQVSDGVGARVHYISCPVYRDTDLGRKSGCWLADDNKSGVRYDVSHSPTKPDWGKPVLVEGIVTSDANVCGGVVLKPARVSVLEGSCPRSMIPAEDFVGRAYTSPERVVRPLSVPRDAQVGPFEETTFYVFFDFDRDFVIYQLGDFFVDQAAAYVLDSKPKKVVITGYAARHEVDGRNIKETRSIARKRAERIREAFVRLGVDPKVIKIRTRSNAKAIEVADADGLPEASKRRVEIRVVPRDVD